MCLAYSANQLSKTSTSTSCGLDAARRNGPRIVKRSQDSHIMITKKHIRAVQCATRQSEWCDFVKRLPAHVVFERQTRILFHRHGQQRRRYSAAQSISGNLGLSRARPRKIAPRFRQTARKYLSFAASHSSPSHDGIEPPSCPGTYSMRDHTTGVTRARWLAAQSFLLEAPAIRARRQIVSCGEISQNHPFAKSAIPV